MAQSLFRADLSSISYPFQTSSFGRTVLMEGPTYVSSRYNSAEESIPYQGTQVLYLENAMPTRTGLSAISFTGLVPGSSSLSFSNIYGIRDDKGNRFKFTIDASGQGWIINMDGDRAWTKINLPSSILSGWSASKLITLGYAQGVTYIFIEALGCIKLDTSVGSFPYSLVEVTLTGITAANITGIVGAVNYLILWDKSTVYWSNIDNPTDFVPSLATGADSTKVSDLRGAIKYLMPLGQGFIIYTANNAVSATYTNNTRYPWLFKEVPESTGVKDYQHVAFEDNRADHIVWSTSGLVKLNRSSMEFIYPELSDYLTKKVFETFNFLTGEISQAIISSTPNLKLSFIASRFFVVSYGTGTNYTGMYVLDAALSRWGHIKIDHVDSFTYSAESLGGPVTNGELINTTNEELLTVTNEGLLTYLRSPGTAGNTFCVLAADGSISLVDFNEGNPGRIGLVVLGKFQYVRDRLIQLLGLEVENVMDSAETYSAKIYSSWDGKKINQVTDPYQEPLTNAGQRSHLCDVEGKNHIIAVKGAFDINSVILRFSPGGYA